MTHPTRRRLLDRGLEMLLEHGYNDLGVQALLDSTGIPKGSFYHHFGGKEDFALAVVDQYMEQVHGALDQSLGDTVRRPLDRIRYFFELTRQAYEQQSYLGCLLGGLGQELSGANPVFRDRIAGCLAAIARRLASCLDEARTSGDLAPDADVEQLASVLVDCWEGAALRSRLLGTTDPLVTMLDFYFQHPMLARGEPSPQ